DYDGDQVQGSFSVNVSDTNTPSTASSMEAPSLKVAATSDSLLVATNEQQQQAANSNTVLVGAIAAAGLMSASQSAAAHVSDIGALHLDSGVSHMSLMGSTSLQSIDASGIVPLFESRMVMRDGGEMLNDSASFHQDSMTQQSLAGQAAAEAPEASQLPAGNDVPVASQAADASSFATGDVAMPSLEALAASVGQHGANAQETGNVAQVLADALAGGGGADIDGLLASLPGNGGSVADALASHGMTSVPGWDMGAFGGFTPINSAFTMETLELHQAAVVHQA
ncbi:MAG TPA: hypothetical protein VM757_05385, partial [Sphingomicrobium sp.]|nr:hypothetical protein [Sphingomicrobium sp.]